MQLSHVKNARQNRDMRVDFHERYHPSMKGETLAIHSARFHQRSSPHEIRTFFLVLKCFGFCEHLRCAI